MFYKLLSNHLSPSPNHYFHPQKEFMLILKKMKNDKTLHISKVYNLQS